MKERLATNENPPTLLLQYAENLSGFIIEKGRLYENGRVYLREQIPSHEADQE